MLVTHEHQRYIVALKPAPIVALSRDAREPEGSLVPSARAVHVVRL
jgi:hypothetical protein